MKLGAFSISLAVKDITASKQFYEALGFEVFGGDHTQGWLILKNGDAIIGLFQGMFEDNVITFNPGWDQNAQNVDPFDDVRAIKTAMSKAGVEIEHETGEGEGPGSFQVVDPDGNRILIDQHR